MLVVPRCSRLRKRTTGTIAGQIFKAHSKTGFGNHAATKSRAALNRLPGFVAHASDRWRGGGRRRTKFIEFRKRAAATPQRKRRRPAQDLGLPPDEDIAFLAKEYLKRQRKHWPTLVAEGLIPESTPSVITAMVADFKPRHRTGIVAPETVEPFLGM